MVTVTHAFNCPLADDPKAAANNEILVSHWNASHVITGLRTVLSADTNYYVSATGSDSHDGLTSGTAWATLAHAILTIGSNVDLAGFTATVNVGAGSFAGFGFPGFYGGGQVRVIGAGSSSTTITAGPNDGVYNDGSCVTLNFTTPTFLWVNAVTLDGTASSQAVGHFALATFLQFGTSVANSADVIFKPPSGGYAVSCSAPSALIGYLGGNYTIQATASTTYVGFQFFGDYGGGFASGTWTINNSPKWSKGFTVLQTLSQFDVSGMTFSGSATGPRYNLTDASVMENRTLVTLPGNAAGAVDATSSYNEQFYAQPIAGLPTASNLPDGAWGLFSDTTGVFTTDLATNRNGIIEHIRRVSLIANAVFYVSTTGSDSNPGTLAQPWATPQHAADFIANNIDAAGFNIVISLSTGSYVGPQFNGFPLGCPGVALSGDPTNVSHVTLTYNTNSLAGATIDIEAGFSGNILICNLTIDTSNNGIVVDFNDLQVYAFNLAFTTGGGDVFGVYNPYCNLTYNFNPLTWAINIGSANNAKLSIAGSWSSVFNIASYSEANLLSPSVTLVSTPAWTTFTFSNNGLNVFNISGTLTSSGSATGSRGTFAEGAIVNIGSNTLPGSTGPSIDGSTFYNSHYVVQATSGSSAPTTTDLPSNLQWGVFTDGGSNFWVAANNSGTIKKVALV